MDQEDEVPQVEDPEVPLPRDDLEEVREIFRTSRTLRFEGIVKTDVSDWIDSAHSIFAIYGVEPRFYANLAQSSLYGLAGDILGRKIYEPNLKGWTDLGRDMEEAFHPSLVHRRFLIRSFHWGPIGDETYFQYLDRFENLFAPLALDIPRDEPGFCDALLRSLPSKYSKDICLPPEPNVRDLVKVLHHVIGSIQRNEARKSAHARQTLDKGTSSGSLPAPRDTNF